MLENQLKFISYCKQAIYNIKNKYFREIFTWKGVFSLIHPRLDGDDDDDDVPFFSVNTV